MSIRLPPLNALRCFEAAARKGNFTLAADELYLTPSAVSHQIRALEDHLGVLLFSRAGRRMMLTETGQTYFKLTSKALETIAAARSVIEQTQQRESLCIGVAPDFTTFWLMARLPEFMAEHPNLQLELITSPRENGLVERQIDVEIRYGHGKWPTLTAFHLMDDHLVPVCSPGLATASKPLQEPHDVLKHTLIYTGNRPINWRHWGEQFDVSGIEGAASMQIDRCALAVRAAIEGIGIALESRLSVEAEIRAGKLVMPFPEYTCDEEAYYLVFPKTGNELLKVRRFREWIVSKTKSETQAKSEQRASEKLRSLTALVDADA